MGKYLDRTASSLHESVMSGWRPYVAFLVILGGLGAVASHYVDFDGRGSEIAECTSDYSARIQVVDRTVLQDIGSLAEKYSITDPENPSWGSNDIDIADKPGELACEQPLGGVVQDTVLLPAGEYSLDNAGLLSGDQLPDGLKWLS